ncbi:hypothetical protein Tco_0967380 [Tanacetum coccineum]
MNTTNRRIEDKKPSELILPPMDILETFPCVKDVDYITRDLAVSSVRSLRSSSTAEAVDPYPQVSTNQSISSTQFYQAINERNTLAVIKKHEAPPIVTTSEEQISLISLNEADEFNQEDSTNFDGNTVFVLYDAPNFKEVKSSTTALDPSNMHEFHQVQPLTHIWTKAYPLEQVISDPSKPMMTRQRIQTDSEVCMYALTVSTFDPKNIKKAMSDHSLIESMQDELHQFERLDVLELVPRLDEKNIIAGYKQEEGIDFEAFAPVARLEAV